MIPLPGKGPGHTLYTAWGHGDKSEAVCYGTEIPLILRGRQPPVEKVAIIRAGSWEEASDVVRRYESGDGGVLAGWVG